jgi:hypothetical protein
MLAQEPDKTVRFCLISTDPRAYLLGRRDDGPAFTVEMSEFRPGLWFADVPLAEGTYRLRYYCGDENQMTYYGPASAHGGWQDGLDGVVVVPAPTTLVTLPVSWRTSDETGQLNA